MVAEFKGFNNSLSDRLIAELKSIPEDWALTPVDGNKRPYRKGWQSEPALSRKDLINEIKGGRAKGYGVRTGLSVVRDGQEYYLMAVDLDGQSASTKMLELSGGEDLPKTVGFTSQRIGRSQHLFLVPQQYIDGIKTKKYPTGKIGDDNKPEQLEMRLKNLQSVLPPSVHPITRGYEWLPGCSPSEVEVAIAPSWVIENMLVERKETQPSPQAQAVPTIPLYQQEKNNTKWNDVDYGRSYLAALKLYRVDDYTDWTTAGMALKSIDECLFVDWDKWSQQSSKYKPGECLRKWETFQGNGVGIGTLAYMAEQDGWKNPFKEAPPKSHRIKTKVNSGGGGDDGGNVVNFPSAPLDLNAIRKQIETFLLGDYSESELIVERTKVRTENPRLSEREVKSLFDSVAEEVERTKSRGDVLKDIDRLLKTSERSLKLSDYLPPELSEPLTQWCNWLNIREEVALTTVLTTASSLHKVGTKLLISNSGDFEVTPNMFAAVIAESGQMKSPIFRTLAKKPLRQLKIEAQQFYLEQYKDWEIEHNKWLDDKSDALGKGEPYHEPEPKPPNKPAPFYFNHATGEGITTAAATNPDKTLFALVDELAGYFKSQDAYRGGKGSDKEDVLSYHGGEGKTVLRSGGLKADVDEIYLSIYGTIQPQIVKRLMGNGDDEAGQWARFFFVHQPLHPFYMSEVDSGGVNPIERVTAAYRNCFAVPQQLYKLSPEAYRLLAKFNNSFQQQAISHPKPGIRVLFGKVRGHTGVLAVNLHVLTAAALGVKVGTEISASTMARAIALMKFYIGQSKMLHASVEGELSGHLLKLIEMSKRFESCGREPWVSQRQVYDSKAQLDGRRAKSGDIRSWMKELELMGRGSTRIQGGNLEFSYKVVDQPSSEESGEQVSQDFPQSEPLIYKDYKPTGETGESGDIFSNFESTLSSKDILVQKPAVNRKVEAETFSEKSPHFPHLASNDHTASVPGGETLDPVIPHFPSTNNNDVVHPDGVKDESPQIDHALASDQPAEVSSGDGEVSADDYPNDGSSQASLTPLPTAGSDDLAQVAPRESVQGECASANVADQVTEKTTQDYPGLGTWGKLDGFLVQVIKHNLDNQTIFLDGAKRGNGVFGSYPIDRFQALTQLVVVKMKHPQDL